MNKPAIPPVTQAVAPAQAEAFARALHAILAHLCVLLAARFTILGPLAGRFHTRLMRASRRIVALLCRLAAGRAPARPRPGRPSGKPAIRLPRGHAWLVRLLGHHAASYASQLEHLLNDPQFAPLLAAAPRTRHILAPVLCALGLPHRPDFRPRRGSGPPPRPLNDPLPLAINLPPMAPFRLDRPRPVLRPA